MSDVFDAVDPTPGYRYDAERGTWVVDRPAAVPSAQLEPELRWTPNRKPTYRERSEQTAREARIAAYDRDVQAVRPNPYAVGSIFHTSWGYDQTNVEFYVVVRETKASVWLERCGEYVRDGRLFPDPEFQPGTGPAEVHRKGKHGTYVRMDYVRHAWPYNGGGCYSTAASGGAGH